MKNHCKGCQYHHNAGHHKDSNLAKKFNDWCCQYGMNAKQAIGHCKLNNGKKGK